VAVLIRELGWTPSQIVREGLRVLAANYLRRKKRGVIGLGKFVSRVTDLGSNKKHLRDFWSVKPALLDTGVIVALLDRSEKFHQACADVGPPNARPADYLRAVIAESCYLLRSLPGAPEAVLDKRRRGHFPNPFQLSRDAPRRQASPAKIPRP